MTANGHLSVAEGCCRPRKAAKAKTDMGLLSHRQPPLHLYCHLKRQFVLCITYGQLCIEYGQLCYMYIQLCNNNDCHGNDYDAFGKWRDRIGGWRERIGCCGDGHGGLVTVETGARVGRHESTYRTIRGHVTYDTRRQWWPAHGQWWSAHGQWWSAHGQWWSARRRRGVVGERRGLALRRRGLMGEQRGLAAAERTNGDGGWDSRDGDGQETAEPRTQQDA